MAHWLVKSEPDDWSWDQQVAKGREGAEWTGIRNFSARNHLRAMKKGEQAFFYHTGKEKAIVAIATAASDAYPDPKDATKKAFVVDVAPVKKLTRPVTLAEIKADRAFASFPLVRMSRLSVMPVTDEEWARIETMSRA